MPGRSDHLRPILLLERQLLQQRLSGLLQQLFSHQHVGVSLRLLHRLAMLRSGCLAVPRRHFS